MTTKTNPLLVIEAAAEMFQGHEAPNAARSMREARAAVAELVEAASHRVARSFEEARDMDDRKENPIWCEVDVLNPCWKVGRPITVPLRHWGWTPGDVGDGWNACPQCRLRAALAAFEVTP